MRRKNTSTKLMTMPPAKPAINMVKCLGNGNHIKPQAQTVVDAKSNEITGDSQHCFEIIEVSCGLGSLLTGRRDVETEIAQRSLHEGAGILLGPA